MPEPLTTSETVAPWLERTFEWAVTTVLIGLGTAAIMVLTVGSQPAPYRDVAAELRMTLLSAPFVALLGCTAVRGLQRKRAAWLLLLVIAVLSRVVLLAGLTRVAQGPEFSDGYIFPDSLFFGTRARGVMSQLSSPHPLYTDHSASRTNPVTEAAIVARLSMLGARKELVRHEYLMGLLMSWTGYSVGAGSLPFAMLGGLLIMFSALVCQRLFSPWVGQMIYVWLLLDPSYWVISTAWHEDGPTSLLLLYVLDQLKHGHHRLLSWSWRVALGFLAMTAIRPFIVSISVGMLLTSLIAALRQKLVRSLAYVALMMLIVASIWLGATTTVQGTVIGRPPASLFFAGLLGNLILIPGPLSFINLTPAMALVAGHTAMGFYWAPLVALCLLGVHFWRRGRLFVFPSAAMLALFYFVAGASRYPLSYGSVRLRMPVMALFLGLAWRTVQAIRNLPPVEQRRAWLRVALVSILLYTVQVVFSLGLYYQRRIG